LERKNSGDAKKSNRRRYKARDIVHSQPKHEDVEKRVLEKHNKNTAYQSQRNFTKIMETS
jgi:hypothetical protein